MFFAALIAIILFSISSSRFPKKNIGTSFTLFFLQLARLNIAVFLNQRHAFFHRCISCSTAHQRLLVESTKHYMNDQLYLKPRAYTRRTNILPCGSRFSHTFSAGTVRIESTRELCPSKTLSPFQPPLAAQKTDLFNRHHDVS